MYVCLFAVLFVLVCVQTIAILHCESSSAELRSSEFSKDENDKSRGKYFINKVLVFNKQGHSIFDLSFDILLCQKPFFKNAYLIENWK